MRPALRWSGAQFKATAARPGVAINPVGVAGLVSKVNVTGAVAARSIDSGAAAEKLRRLVEVTRPA